MTPTPARRPFRNFLALGGGEIGARAIGFVGTALLARRLGVEAFGMVGFAMALAAYFIVFVGPGLGELGAREIARRPRETRRIVAGVTGVRFLISLGAGLLLVGVAAFLPMQPLTRLVVALSAVPVLTAGLDVSWAYRGLERGAPVAAGQMIAQTCYVLGIIALVVHPVHVTRVPLLQALGEVVALVVLLLPLTSARSWRGWFKEGRRALSSGVTAIGNRILRTVIVTADVILLGLLVNEAAVGLYSAAYRLCFLVTAIAAAAHAAHFPAVVRAVRDRTGETEALSNVTHLTWLAVAPLVAGGMALAPGLMALLFGEEFVGGASALRLLLLGIGVLSLQGALRTVYLATDRLTAESRVLGAAAVANVGLTLLLIPRWGIEGAALATFASELVGLGGALLFVRRMGLSVTLRPLVAPTVAAALMGFGVWVAPARGTAGMLLLVIGGALAYGGLLLLFPRARGGLRDRLKG